MLRSFLLAQPAVIGRFVYIASRDTSTPRSKINSCLFLRLARKTNQETLFNKNDLKNKQYYNKKKEKENALKESLKLIRSEVSTNLWKFGLFVGFVYGFKSFFRGHFDRLGQQNYLGSLSIFGTSQAVTDVRDIVEQVRKGPVILQQQGSICSGEVFLLVRFSVIKIVCDSSAIFIHSLKFLSPGVPLRLCKLFRLT